MSVSADKIVLTSAMVTLGSTTASAIMPEKYGGRSELPSMQLIFGSALAFTGLSILADFAPGIAGPLSACVAMTALTAYGIPIMERYFTDTPTTQEKTP